MKPMTFAILALAAGLIAGAAQANKSPGFLAAAVGDPGRPAEDKARDADRKPGEMLKFSGVKPGDTVLEMIPGGGYFTRLLSKVVGPTGHVYAAAPDPKGADAEPAASKIAADPAYANVTVVGLTPAVLTALPPLDLIWTSQNYHDLHLSRIHADVPALDRLWLKILKPGGHLVVIDHVAAAGSPVTETADKLHRIDPAAVRSEVEAAGFVFDGQDDALRNPADPHTANVFDPSIRGHTDQFAFRFRKP